MKSVCVFCGSNFGDDGQFEKEAYSMGKELAEKEISLVYGGAKVGLMELLPMVALNMAGR